MHKRLLEILLGLCLTWALVVSFLYWRLKSNPRVIAVTADLGMVSGKTQQSFQLSEMEKLTFLRQYLDRYFNYDSNNFWQSQTSLTFLMSPELREKRIEDVRRLRDKIQQKNLSQRAQLLSLISSGQDDYRAVIEVQLNEENKKSELYVTLSLRLGTSERTLENPWGLIITEMTFKESSPTALTLSHQVHIKEKTPTVLTFPCAIENVETASESSLTTKITTLNVSEIQLLSDKKLSQPVEMTASCKDTEFKFEVLAQTNESDIFKAFPLTAAQPRKKEIGNKPRSKDIYDKTIENVLGIKVDN